MMSWFNVWDGLKTKTCRYLLQRYLGQFLKSQVELQQLKVDLYNGRAVVNDVSLKVEALNDLFESQGWGVEVVTGRIGCLTVDVPWNALMTNDSSVEVSDLFITLRPVKRKPTGTSMLESMWSSVSSSIQMAEECMKQSDEDIPFEISTNSIAGLQKFAETIDNVLNRIHAKFTNTIIVIEHALPNSDKKLVIIFKIDDIDYKNETGTQSKRNIQAEHTMTRSAENESNLQSSMNLMPSLANHNLILNNVTAYAAEHFTSNEYNDGGNWLFHLNQFAGNPNPIIVPIVELKGCQKVQIKTKQTESIDGPKVCMEIEIGTIFTLLTPRHVHQLVKIINSFNEQAPDHVALINKAKQNKIREEFAQSEQRTMMSGVINKSGNWCTDDDIISLKSRRNRIRLRMFSESHRMDDSFSSSFSTSNTVTTKFNQRVSSLETSGEILRFKIQIASITAVALHKDVIKAEQVRKNTSDIINENSLSHLVNFATSFFAKISDEHSDGDLKSFFCLRNKDYLYLQLSPIFVNGNQQRNQQILLTKTDMTITKVDFCEVLDRKTSYLLHFDRKENCSEGYHKRPEFSIALKSSFSCTDRNCVSNTANITLEKCTVVFDISLYDRLSAVFGVSPFNDYKSVERLNVESGAAKSNLQLTVSTALCQIHLRFPIMDAREQDDPEKVPWWKQNIREDFLILTLLSATFTWDPTKFSIMSNQIDAYYCDGNIRNVVDILKSKIDVENMETNRLPTITVEMNSNLNNVSMCSEPTPESKSDDANPNGNSNSPFSAKHVFRQSDAAHGLCGEMDSEDSFLPGETDELNIFCERAKNTSKIKISVYLPIANVVLESKQLYEIIYNRLNSDLFMWVPTSPHFQNKAHIKQSAQSFVLTKSLEQFFDIPMYDNKYCENKYMLDSYFERSCSTNEMSESSVTTGGSSIYQSASEKIMQSNIETKSNIVDKTSSACAVEIILDQVALSLFVPVRDTESHVLPGQTGKFDLQAKNLRVFAVTGFNNNENLNYVCLQLHEIEVYHCGLVPSNKHFAAIDNQFEIDDFMESTFYNNLPNAPDEIQTTLLDKRKEVVSLVIEIKKVPKDRIKRLRVTTGISRAVLRHNPTTPSYSWLNQLIDFLDVTDFPIEGYHPYAVITEMQIHLWDCLVDYRPNNFPYRALIDIGFFTISSNVISSINGCNLRFIAEECALSVAPYKHSNQQCPKNQISFLDRECLVTVLQIGLFDISLRLSEQSLIKSPKIDLRCSIQDVHLRTCADSAKAFAQLMAHIANDGITIGNDDDDHDAADHLKIPSSDNIVGHPISEHMTSSISIANREQQHVKKLVAEALQDEYAVIANKSAQQKKETAEKGFELFYFPDEGTKLKPSTSAKTPPHVDTVQNYDLENFETNVILNSYYAQAKDQMCSQVESDLGNIYEDKHNSSSSSDDFCVIQDSEKTFLNQCGVKQISVSDDPLRIVDNHFFLPEEKPDLLRTPPNFPVPEYRYTLCEMSFVWHLYGGNDFSLDQDTNTRKKRPSNASMMSDTYKYGVSHPKVISSANTSKAHVKNARSGPGRNSDVLVEVQFTKIRVSHEVYPTISTHASRQVLLIGDFEIRDRLRSSDINKFLYHPTVKNLGNRTNDNMVVVKALHMRPNPKKSSAEECSLRISILPIKLNIDQDTLLFLETFFANLSSNTSDELPQDESETSRSSGVSMRPTEPILAVDDLPESLKDLKARNMVSKNLDILIDEEPKIAIKIDAADTPNSACPIYFREVIFSPALPICLDYQGRRIELSRGPVAGFLMGLAQLQGSGICLREIENRRGLLGWNKLFMYLCKEWLKDIKRNQLPKILSGLGPTNAVLQLFQGIYDLFWLPIEQYQKDGRVIRGFQLGAQSFSARTALAALEITSRIIHLLQFTAETTFDMLSAGPSVRRRRRAKPGRMRLGRPKDMREGFTNAYMIVKEGINTSANNLIETAIVEHDQKGYTGAVGAVMRQIPQLVVCPAVLATQATTNILGGAKSSLVPDAKLEARDKWKEPN